MMNVEVGTTIIIVQEVGWILWQPIAAQDHLPRTRGSQRRSEHVRCSQSHRSSREVAYAAAQNREVAADVAAQCESKGIGQSVELRSEELVEERSADLRKGSAGSVIARARERVHRIQTQPVELR